jgi:hypothetical protein
LGKDYGFNFDRIESFFGLFNSYSVVLIDLLFGLTRFELKCSSNLTCYFHFPQMNSLNHYAIGDSTHKEIFMTLCIDSETMDKQDFVDSNYYLDEADYNPKTRIKLSSIGKGKRPIEAGSSRDTYVTPSFDAVDEAEPSIDPTECNVDLTPASLDAAGGNIVTSNMRGSSGSSAQQDVTPLSNRIRHKRKAIPSPSAPPMDLNEFLRQTMEANRKSEEKQKKENKRARQENKDMLTQFMGMVPGLLVQAMKAKEEENLKSSSQDQGTDDSAKQI